jgi:DNA-binding NarL/FixJ family response regulator
MLASAHTPCAPRVTVGIADDSPAMREGLARLVGDECDLKVSGSAATAAELRDFVQRSAPGVLVMDLVLHEGDGLALIKDLVALKPGLRIVVFTSQPEEVYAERCLRAGARAFISKRDCVATLFRTIRQVADGGLVVPAGISVNLFGVDAGPGRAGGRLAGQLSDRELQVFRLAGLGLPTREVAGKLGVSIKTVETHRENIKNKLALGSHTELVARAAQWLRDSGGN